MNYFSKLNSLLAEAFSFKQYRRMHPAIIVFLAILMAPLYLASLALSAFYYAYAIGYKFLSMPADTLRAFYKFESTNVQHATQAIIYLICLPFVYMLQILLSFFSLAIGFLFFIITIILQVASLNGIDFKPFILDKSTRSKEALAPMPLINALFFVVNAYLLLLISVVFNNGISTIALILFMAFIVLYPIFVFKKDGSDKELNKIAALVITIVLGVLLVGNLCVKAVDGLGDNSIETSVYKSSYSYGTKTIRIEETDTYKITFDLYVEGTINGSYFSGYSWKGKLYEGQVIIVIESVEGSSYYSGNIDIEIKR